MPSSAYIHIPFCKNKCKYCSFISFAGYDDDFKSKYVDTLIEEIRYFYKNEQLKTLYFGGGTPSLLSMYDIERIFKCFYFDDNAEITIEINPETVDFSYLQYLKNVGVNRLSIGVQSFNDSILREIGRVHNSERAISVINMANKIGFSNISVDFIYGLPKQNIDLFVRDLKMAMNLPVQHISLYGLKIEDGCYFYNHYPKHIADDDMQADMYLKAINELEENGFVHYEISNFSKEGYESKHNLNYWNCKEYYGFGLAAHGFVDGVRYSNFTDFNDYISAYKDKSFKQKLTIDQRLEEMIFLGLRRGIGINVSEINKTFSIDFEALYKDPLNKYLESHHIIKTLNGYKFSNDGFLLSNIILADFIL